MYVCVYMYWSSYKVIWVNYNGKIEMPSFQVAYSLDLSFLNSKVPVNLLGDWVVKNLPANAGDMG